MMMPLSGSLFISTLDMNDNDFQLIQEGQILNPPNQDKIPWHLDNRWWNDTSLDMDRNGIHDSLQSTLGVVNVGISYFESINDADREILVSMGYAIKQEISSVNAILLGSINSSEIYNLAEINGIAMVERYGSLVFYGDIQTPAVKAQNSTLYPGAWDLGVSGKGINIALTDTGVDEEHPV